MFFDLLVLKNVDLNLYALIQRNYHATDFCDDIPTSTSAGKFYPRLKGALRHQKMHLVYIFFIIFFFFQFRDMTPVSLLEKRNTHYCFASTFFAILTINIWDVRWSTKQWIPPVQQWQTTVRDNKITAQSFVSRSLIGCLCFPFSCFCRPDYFFFFNLKPLVAFRRKSLYIPCKLVKYGIKICLDLMPSTLGLYSYKLYTKRGRSCVPEK